MSVSLSCSFVRCGAARAASRARTCRGFTPRRPASGRPSPPPACTRWRTLKIIPRIDGRVLEQPLLADLLQAEAGDGAQRASLGAPAKLLISLTCEGPWLVLG